MQIHGLGGVHSSDASQHQFPNSRNGDHLRYQPATTDDELLSYVDIDDNEIGLLPRAQIHRRGLWHRAVHVLVLDDVGRLIIQQRSASKDIYGLHWECVGGHTVPNEDYQSAARREVREELGVETSAPRLLTQHEPCIATGWEFVHVFSAITQDTPQPDAREVAAVDRITWEELLKELQHSSRPISPSFRYTVWRLVELGLHPAAAIS